MIQLLNLCGFEVDEIESELSRVEKVFSRLAITAGDIERGKERLNKYYDLKLQGVRKALRLCIRELVNTVLAREDGKRKILYGFMSPGFEILGTALVSKSKEIFVTNITGPLQFVLGCIFNKMAPVLEAAEQRWLKAGKVYHCGNVKALVGLLALDFVPKPDLLVTSGQLCDTAPKTIDLVQELYGISTCCYDTCQDREFREYPNSKRVMELYARSIKRLVLKIQEVVGFEITNDMLLESINTRGELANTFRNLQNLKESSDPVPISATHESLWNCVNPLSYSMSDLQKAVAVLDTTYKELADRVERGEGILEKGAPRVLSLLPPHFEDPRWDHLPYELGIAVVSTESGFYPFHGKHTLDTGEAKPEDPYELIGSGLQRSLAQSLSARIAILLEVCKRLKLDGILGRYHVGCRTNLPDPFLMRDVIPRQVGIPVLLLEWEGFDPRFYNEDQYKRQIELFKDVMNSRRRG